MASRSSLTAVGLSTTAVRALRKLRKRYAAGELGETFDQAERRRLLFLRWLLSEKRIQV